MIELKQKKIKENLLYKLFQLITRHLDVNIRQGLMKAREIILVVTGAEKSEVIKRLYEENGKSNFYLLI